MKGTVRRRENGDCDHQLGVEVKGVGQHVRWGRSGSKTHRDAAWALRHVVAAPENGRTVQASSQTVAQFVEPWQWAVLVSGRPTTCVKSGRFLMHVVPDSGDATLLQYMTAIRVNLLYGRLLSGRARGQGGPSPATVLKIYTMLHRAVSDAVRWHVSDWATDPCWWPR